MGGTTADNSPKHLMKKNKSITNKLNVDEYVSSNPIQGLPHSRGSGVNLLSEQSATRLSKNMLREDIYVPPSDPQTKVSHFDARDAALENASNYQAPKLKAPNSNGSLKRNAPKLKFDIGGKKVGPKKPEIKPAPLNNFAVEAFKILGGEATAAKALTKQHGEKLIATRYGLPPHAADQQKQDMYNVEEKAFVALQNPNATLGNFFKLIGVIPDVLPKKSAQRSIQGSSIYEEVTNGGAGDDLLYIPVDDDKSLETNPETNKPTSYMSAPTWLQTLDIEAQKIGKGVLGPAYEPSMAMLRLAAAFSPGQDIKDMMQGSAELSKAVMAQDGVRFAEDSAMLGGSLAAIFMPGSYSGVKNAADDITAQARSTRDMPYAQRRKHEGINTVIPNSVEENINRGTDALVSVLKSDQADMAAMHRKDLGWIAFEPGNVNFNRKGEIVGGGLGKIMTKHPQDIAMLPEVIAKGKIQFQNMKNRRNALLHHKGYRSVFRLDDDGERVTWVLTHFSLDEKLPR